jgi:hypothetical protein
MVSAPTAKVQRLRAEQQEGQSPWTVLGNKADADTVNEAVSRIGDTKMFSTVENELKLVKPQVDADLASANSELDKVLANSSARIQNAGTQVHKVFDDLISVGSSLRIYSLPLPSALSVPLPFSYGLLLRSFA